MSDITWKTKDGKILNIKDMTTEHIKNCIKAIEEERIEVGEWIPLGYTCDGDGDGTEYEYLDYSYEYIRAFKEELKKRGDIKCMN